MSATALEIETASAQATEALGRALAALLPPRCVVALTGDLASGKTCLVRGMATHVAPGGPVHSPTFTLVNEYGSAPRLFHLDLYRLSGPEEVAELGYEELFDPDGVTVVEWAERAGPLLPARCIRIALDHAGADRRRIVIDGGGLLPKGWRGLLRAAA